MSKYTAQYFSVTVEENSTVVGTTEKASLLAADGSTVLTGDIDLNNHKILNVAKPTTNNGAANKIYVDNLVMQEKQYTLLKSGGTMTGSLVLKGAPTAANEAATKAYVDGILPAFTAADNGKVLGVVDGALAWVTLPSST